MAQQCDRCQRMISPEFAKQMGTCEVCCTKYVASQVNPMLAHVYTIGTGHVTDGVECWCDPHLYRLCSQCDDGEPGCWLCEGDGVVRVGEVLPGDSLLVVHHFIPDGAKIERVGR